MYYYEQSANFHYTLLVSLLENILYAFSFLVSLIVNYLNFSLVIWLIACWSGMLFFSSKTFNFIQSYVRGIICSYSLSHLEFLIFRFPVKLSPVLIYSSKSTGSPPYCCVFRFEVQFLNIFLLLVLIIDLFVLVLVATFEYFNIWVLAHSYVFLPWNFS